MTIRTIQSSQLEKKRLGIVRARAHIHIHHICNSTYMQLCKRSKYKITAVAVKFSLKLNIININFNHV